MDWVVEQAFYIGPIGFGWFCALYKYTTMAFGMVEYVCTCCFLVYFSHVSVHVTQVRRRRSRRRRCFVDIIPITVVVAVIAAAAAVLYCGRKKEEWNVIICPWSIGKRGHCTHRVFPAIPVKQYLVCTQHTYTYV